MIYVTLVHMFMLGNFSKLASTLSSVLSVLLYRLLPITDSWLSSIMDSLCSCCGHGFSLDCGRTWILLRNGCQNGSSLELVPIMDFFRCFWSVLLLYRMEDKKLLLRLMCGEIWGKTVHNLLLCVVQHLNASYDMKILTFSELILLNYFYKRSEILCYFYRGNYIAFHFYKRGDFTITPSRGVILHRYFFKRSTSCHLRSLCKEAYLHSCPYKWGSNFVVYLY